MPGKTGPRPRCPNCNRPLTALLRQRRDAPPEPGKKGRLRPITTHWLECEPCNKVYRKSLQEAETPEAGTE